MVSIKRFCSTCPNVVKGRQSICDACKLKIYQKIMNKEFVNQEEEVKDEEEVEEEEEEEDSDYEE